MQRTVTVEHLGGVGAVFAQLESAVDGVAENAALALAACSARDDSVCLGIMGRTREELTLFASQMRYKCSAVRVRLLQAFANCTELHAAQCADGDGAFAGLCIEVGFMSSLCSALTSDDAETLAYACFALGNLAAGDSLSTYRVPSVSVEQLIAYSQSLNSMLKVNAVRCLRNLMGCSQSVVVAAMDDEVVLVISSLLFDAAVELDAAGSAANPTTGQDLGVITEHCLSILASCIRNDARTSYCILKQGRGLKHVLPCLSDPNHQHQKFAVEIVRCLLDCEQTRLDVFAEVCQSGSVLTILWLLVHEQAEVRTGAAFIVRILVNNRGALKFSTVLFEQGCIPVLYMLMGSDDDSILSCIRDTLQSIFHDIRHDRLMDHFLKALGRSGSTSCHCNITAGLIYLSSGSPELQRIISQEKLLSNILSKLRSPSARGVAVDFLQMISPLMRKEFDSAQAQLSTRHVKTTPSKGAEVNRKDQHDLTLVFKTQDAEAKILKVHRQIFSGSAKMLEMIAALPDGSMHLPIQDTSFVVFEYAVDQLYEPATTEQALGSVKLDMVLNLMALSVQYEFADLREDCRRAILGKTSNASALMVFRSALDCQDALLQAAVFQSLLDQKNLIDIIRTSKKNSSLLIECLLEFVEQTIAKFPVRVGQQAAAGFVHQQDQNQVELV
jgi:hypothetical protein